MPFGGMNDRESNDIGTTLLIQPVIVYHLESTHTCEKSHKLTNGA